MLYNFYVGTIKVEHAEHKEFWKRAFGQQFPKKVIFFKRL